MSALWLPCVSIAIDSIEPITQTYYMHTNRYTHVFFFTRHYAFRVLYCTQWQSKLQVKNSKKHIDISPAPVGYITVSQHIRHAKSGTYNVLHVWIVVYHNYMYMGHTSGKPFKSSQLVRHAKGWKYNTLHVWTVVFRTYIYMGHT